MIRLLRFFLRNFFVKKSTYIILIISILILSFISYVISFLYDNRTYGFVFSANKIWYTTMFFCSIIFVILQVTYIFKKNEEDGVSLFLLSKPISRLKQILCQLTLLLVAIIFFALSIFFIGVFVGIIDKATNKIELIKFAFSILIANIIIMCIFGSLAILTSLWISSKGMISVWSLFIFFLPTFSIILATTANSPFSHGNAFAFEPITKSIEDSKLNLKPQISKNRTINFDYTSIKDSYQQKEWDGYINAGKNWTRWIDPYAQLNELYYSFSNSNENISGGKWIQKSVIATKKPNDWAFNYGGAKYLLLWKVNEPQPLIGYNKIINYKEIKSYLEQYTTKAAAPTNVNPQPNINLWTFERQLSFINLILEILEVSQDGKKVINDAIDAAYFGTNPSSSDDSEEIKNDFLDRTSWYSLTLLYYLNSIRAMKMNLEKTNLKINNLIYNKENSISIDSHHTSYDSQKMIFLKVGQTYNELIEVDIIPKISLIFIWLSIFTVATITPSYFYIKRKYI